MTSFWRVGGRRRPCGSDHHLSSPRGPLCANPAVVLSSPTETKHGGALIPRGASPFVYPGSLHLTGSTMGVDNAPQYARYAAAIAGAIAAAYGAKKLLGGSKSSDAEAAKRDRDAADIAAWRDRVFAGNHWAPLAAYAARSGIKLAPPPTQPGGGPFMPVEPYSWFLTGRVLNFLAGTLPDAWFMPQSEVLDIIRKEFAATPAVECLGGARANDLVRDRLLRLFSSIKWGELSGVGRAILNQRAKEWCSQRRAFFEWYAENWRLVVDEQGNDLKPLKPMLFICGAPRTGTTLLQSLLSLGPEVRSPALYESTILIGKDTPEHPFPPKSPADVASDPRLPAVIEQIAALPRVLGEDTYQRIAASHPTINNPLQADEDSLFEWYNGACFMYEFLTAGAIDLWEEVAADAPEWREWTDCMTLALKRFYQMLAVGFEPASHWVGKSPYHSAIIPSLLRAFPDAHFVSPQRDPRLTVPSLARTQEAVINGLHLREDSLLNDRRLLGRWTARESWALREVNLGPFAGEWKDKLITMRYDVLIKDPVAAVAEVHRAAGLAPPSAEHAKEIARFLEEQPQGKHGRNKYSLEAYALTEKDLEPVRA
ncbi:P-loop containing nucleoside triphosphate hydrolase protein [Hyaloraphidium curvatum]|nr:P-loop containing nucleoside triphosphate hydrolase protein [Hyaloraphidium curvatum]